jgi:hypothetical protein
MLNRRTSLAFLWTLGLTGCASGLLQNSMFDPKGPHATNMALNRQPEIQANVDGYFLFPVRAFGPKIEEQLAYMLELKFTDYFSAKVSNLFTYNGLGGSITTGKNSVQKSDNTTLIAVLSEVWLFQGGINGIEVRCNLHKGKDDILATWTSDAHWTTKGQPKRLDACIDRLALHILNSMQNAGLVKLKNDPAVNQDGDRMPMLPAFG